MNKIVSVIAVAVALLGVGLILATPSQQVAAQQPIIILQGEAGVSTCGNDPCGASVSCALQGDPGPAAGSCSCN